MKYVFTDCFDTLIERREHPYQVVYRWAQCVCRLYPGINPDELFSKRMKITKSMPIDKVGVQVMYEELFHRYQRHINDKEHFLRTLRMLELNCEKSTATINKKVISFLENKKAEGSKIYCITDYHLSSEDIHELLTDLGVECIEEVFSSASYGKTKHEGELYEVVLNKLSASPADCLMIGDNKLSDIRNAEINGIATKYFSNTFHKNLIRAKNKLGIKENSVRAVGKNLWRNSNTYDEFALIFYTFCVRLYNEVVSGVTGGGYQPKIVFLAREGLFLKKCFEIYQDMCVPTEKHIKTEYLKCSRRAIHSVQREKCLPDFYDSISVINYFMSIGFSEEEGQSMAKELDIKNPYKVVDDFSHSSEAKVIWTNFREVLENRISQNRQAFDQYIHEIAADNEVILVDVGWIGRMQQGIDVLFDDISTRSFYIGIYQNLFEQPFVERHGLVFHKTESGERSQYFNIFRTNIQLYEQLLSAPHGSACYYRVNNGNVCVYEKWEKDEKKLYEEVIKDVQRRQLSLFEGLCTYTFHDIEQDCYAHSKYNKDLALIMLRSSLLQSRGRLDFMERLITGFSQNFQQQSIGMEFSVKDVHENPINVICHPDRFVRYVAKLGVVTDKKGRDKLGRFIMQVYYCYTRIVLHL